MTSPTLNPRQARQAKDALRTGKYQLLLGAGASAGAKTPKGPIPLSGELVKILQQVAPGAPISETTSLPRAYQRAITEVGEDKVWRALKSCFTPATHQEWFNALVSLPWSKIWTLNVDDAVERSYNASASATGRALQTVTWDEPYSETGALDVIHLHGHVLGSKPIPLIFSYAEYMSASAERPVWHQMLGGLLSVEPFIIIGARLLDDPDVEALILRNKCESQAPSFVVDPFIEEGNAWELEKNGFIVVRDSADQFISWVRAELNMGEDVIDALRDSRRLSLPQFDSLETNRSAPRPRGHDFYAGDAPIWRDILDNFPAELGAAVKLDSVVRNWLDCAERLPQLELVYGVRFSGVTTNLLMAAKGAISQGARVVWFNKQSRWSPELLVDIAEMQPTVVLVDGSYDFADDIDRTMQVAQERKAPLLIVAAETFGNELRLEERLSLGYNLHVVRSRSRLTRNDAEKLYLRVWERARAGKLEHVNKIEAIDILASRDVFSAMLEFEYGSGFKHRMTTEVSRLTNTWESDLVLLLALASTEHREVSPADSALAVGVSPNRILDELSSDSSLQSLIQLTGDSIVARQREKMLPIVVEKFGPDESLNRVLCIILRLAPAVTRAGLRERNRLPMLVTHLMTYRMLARSFPGADFDSFYDALQPKFGSWSGRFWEQRAIRAKAVGDWGKAESFAGRAVTLYDDPYTRTTYGTILLNRATNLAWDADSNWRSFYDRSQKEFDRAHELDTSNRITLFANLDGSVELLRALPTDSPFKSELMKQWEELYAVLAVDLMSTNGLESNDRLEKLSQKYGSLKSGS